MTNTICGFNQPKLLELGIDIIEAQLLAWFVKFYLAYDTRNNCDAMPKQYHKDETGQIVEYGWVRNRYVIEQLPILGINSEKVIARRFEHLVKVGIFSKRVINTQKGKLCLYHLNGEMYNTLVTCEDRKVSVPLNTNKEEELETLQEKTKVSEINNDYVKQNESEIINPEISVLQVTPKYQAEVTQKSFAENISKNDGKITQKSLPQVTPKYQAEVTQKSFALNDSLVNDSLVNDSLVNDSLVNDSLVNDSLVNVVKNTAAAISTAITKYFGENAFDTNFTTAAAKYLNTKNKQIDVEDYILFVKALVDKRNPTKPKGLFYKLFFQQDITQDYFANLKEIQIQVQKFEEQKIQQEKNKITCPVCGTRFLDNGIGHCPCCELDIQKFNDKKAINKKIKYLKLSEEDRNQYEKDFREEVSQIIDMRKEGDHFKEYLSRYKVIEQKLDSKYGLDTED